MPRFHGCRKRTTELLDGTHPLGIEAERAREGGKVRTLQLDTNSSAFEMGVLNIPQNSVCRIVEQDDHNRRILLTRDSKLSDVDQQSTIAAQRDDRFRRRADLRSDRHRQSLTNSSRRSMQRGSRIPSEDQTAPPR